VDDRHPFGIAVATDGTQKSGNTGADVRPMIMGMAMP
jgi:hypothetical protein